MSRRAFDITASSPYLMGRGRRRVIAAALFATVAGAVLATSSAKASEHPADAPPRLVRGVPLASICDACGVVSEQRVQTREEPDNHVGAVAGAVVGGLAGHVPEEHFHHRRLPDAGGERRRSLQPGRPQREV